MASNVSQEVKNDARKISDAAVDVADSIGQEINDGARQLGSAIKDASTAVSQNVAASAQETYDSLVARSKEGAMQLESKVQNSPLLAIGISFGVGLIVSALCFRRN